MTRTAVTTTTAKSGVLAMMTLALAVGIAAREIKGKGSENRHGDRAQGGDKELQSSSYRRIQHFLLQ
ncbi:hypothetical protein PILCRDRAFT_3157 [Piloderma croceum F 1598]|uniref:Uncharacterized protein n=1 Tax=Piloderma croceum (strain F 1598) TaxID=765440 RepID=A0A0C3GBV0_PILCF|nr:hypothetical protein PILCRDRAFT_3157 [Piloderma croceum F 1598]